MRFSSTIILFVLVVGVFVPELVSTERRGRGRLPRNYAQINPLSTGPLQSSNQPSGNNYPREFGSTNYNEYEPLDNTFDHGGRYDPYNDRKNILLERRRQREDQREKRRREKQRQAGRRRIIF